MQPNNTGPMITQASSKGGPRKGPLDQQNEGILIFLRLISYFLIFRII